MPQRRPTAKSLANDVIVREAITAEIVASGVDRVGPTAHRSDELAEVVGPQVQAFLGRCGEGAGHAGGAASLALAAFVHPDPAARYHPDLAAEGSGLPVVGALAGPLDDVEWGLDLLPFEQAAIAVRRPAA